jgi:hypothetical protein
MSVAQYIGATRKGKTIVWDESEVSAISEQEWQKFRREYRRCLSDKVLVERTKEEFETYVAEKIERETKALEAAKSESVEQPPSEGTTNQTTEGTPKGKRANR